MHRWLALVFSFVAAACSLPVPTVANGPSDVVRRAFDRLAAHDLTGIAALSCAGQQGPGAATALVSGLTSPFAAVPGPAFPEAIDMTTIDVSRIRIEPVDGTGQATVQVPVTGEVWLTVDADRAEAAIRAAVAVDTLPPDEATVAATIAAIRAGPTVLDLEQEVGTGQVARVGDAWLLCPNPPSPAPA